MGSSFSGKNADNESWNEVWNKALCGQIRLCGKSAGINEEPVWEELVDAVYVPPKMRKSLTVKVYSPSSTNHLLQMMFMQQQQIETMQTVLLAYLSVIT